MSKALERLLAIHSSPAICGIKASNLICIDYNESIYKEIEELNRKHPKLRFYVLKRTDSKVLILVYRKNVFERTLLNSDNINYLRSIGYDTSSIENMLSDLKDRLNDDEFPHEIGVFLGYDLDDIKSFTSGEKCIYVGYWKVYSRLNEKMEIFNRYTKCRDCVINLINKGFPIESFMR
ncbi:MAG: DUF3793 family protein [Acholeplasmatales bacterium]|nr:DUF3793 family protein [Acholeplasmatales bacterium]